MRKVQLYLNVFEWRRRTVKYPAAQTVQFMAPVTLYDPAGHKTGAAAAAAHEDPAGHSVHEVAPMRANVPTGHTSGGEVAVVGQ